MNDAHLHLLVNHLPIIFPLVGILILIIGFLSKSEAVKRTSYIIFIIGAITAFLSMYTGEGAEHIIKKLDSNARNFIHPHEEVADLLAITSYILAAFSLISLWASFKNKSFAKIASIVTLLFAAVVFFYATKTGTTGGEIKHTEIRSDAVKN